MAKVGRLIAEQLLDHSAPKQRILVLAGRGLNGADATATIQHILARNPVLLDVEDPEEALPALHDQLASRPDFTRSSIDMDTGLRAFEGWVPIIPAPASSAIRSGL